ncbi:MAG: M20/M25/M40 family metallo-hydrolase [Clostridia bacterium]|nr:M20/M25/M40 family metallo-hydrolase [Clostridia bacterium]
MECEQLFKVLENSEKEYLDTLQEACNIESPTAFKEGVDKVGKFFMEIAKKHGWEIEILPQKVSGDAICITMNPNAKGKKVCLSGHMDTVFPVGMFGSPAVKRDEEKMYGPGVLDCKGGIVAAIMAMDGLEKCNFSERPIELILQSDEENESESSNKETIKYMCKKAETAEFFLNLEGYIKDSAVLGRKGIRQYRFNVKGKAAHSSRCYSGASAVLEAAHKIIPLEEFKDEETVTCNCGVINGGTVANSVAEDCFFTADFRFKTNEQMEFIDKKVKEIAQNNTVKGCSCTIDVINTRPAMEITEKNLKLLEKMNKVYKENSMPILDVRFSTGGSDAAYITQMGIPCVDSLGTSGGFIHSTDEFIYLNSLLESAKRIASLIWCIK